MSYPRASFDGLAEARTRRLAERVHQLGPAPMLHAMRDLAAGADLDATLRRYAALDPGFIRQLGGDHFPTPVFALAGSRA